MDLQLDSVEMEVRATFPIEGNVGLSDKVGSAMERLTYVVDIKSPASREEILKLMETAERHCYSINSLRVPVEVVPGVRLNGEELGFTPPVPPELARG